MDLVLHYLLEVNRGLLLAQQVKDCEWLPAVIYPLITSEAVVMIAQKDYARLRKGERIYPLLCILLS